MAPFRVYEVDRTYSTMSVISILALCYNQSDRGMSRSYNIDFCLLEMARTMLQYKLNQA